MNSKTAAPVVLTAEMAQMAADTMLISWSPNMEGTPGYEAYRALLAIASGAVVCRVADGRTGDEVMRINGSATIAQVCDALRKRGFYAEWRGSEQKVREREEAMWGEAALPASPKDQPK